MNEEIGSQHGSNRAWRLAYVSGLISAAVFAIVALRLTLIPEAEQGVERGVIIEVFDSCGPILAPVMAACGAFGLTYLIVLWSTQWIPSVRHLHKGMEDMLSLFAQKDKLYHEARHMRDTATDADKPDSSINVDEDEEASEKFFSEDTSPDDSSNAEQSSAQQAEVDKNEPFDETTESKTQLEPPDPEQSAQQHAERMYASDLSISRALAKIHRWPQRRIKCVIMKALYLQGPDAARAENQVLADQDESNIAADLIWPTICEWMLPLLGFIGTVWGLHKTIPPLQAGIKEMMKALTLSGSDAKDIRDQAIATFTSAFDNLRTAFDTTLFALTLVVFVGLLLYLTRRRAMVALAEVHKIVETVIESCSVRKEESADKYLLAILEALQLGLLETRQGKPASRVAGIREALSRGLFHTSKDQKQQQPLIAAAARLIKKELQDDTKKIVKESQRNRKVIEREIRYVANINSKILKENKFQSLIQFRSLAPDLREVRNKLCDRRVPDGYLIDPDISLVAELPEEHKIHALTIANEAAKACVGSLRRDLSQNFVQETAIMWTHEGYSLQPGISLIASAVHSREDNEGPSMQINSTIAALTYDPRAKRLFVVCTDSSVRVFDEGEMLETSLGAFLVMEHPFAWIKGINDYPVIGGWQTDEDEDQSFRFVLKIAGIDSQITPVGDMKEVFDRFSFDEDDDKRGLGQVKIASDRELLCLVGKGILVVGQIRQALKLELIARMDIGKDVSAVDISGLGRFVVYGLEDGSIFKWYFDTKESSPICLVQPNENTNVSSLHIGAGDNNLGVLADSTIALHELDGSKSPRLFDTYGQSVTHVARSLDRSSLLVATEANMIMLFNFGTKI